MKTSRRADISLALVAFVWGATFVLVKSALADVSTLLFLALRFSLAGVALAVGYHRRLSGVVPTRASHLKGGMAAGGCLFGGYMCQTFGLRLTTPSKSAFLTGLAIVLVPLLGAVFYRTVPRPREAAGVAAAAIGVGLMTLDGPVLAVNPGDLLTIAGAFFFALHILVLGHYAPRDGFERLSVMQILTCAGLALSTWWWMEDAFLAWSFTLLAALAVTGLLATAAAFTIQTWAQQHTSPTHTALIFALEPVFAGITSFAVTGEVLSVRQAAGAVMILAGILLVELKPAGATGHPNK